MATHNYEGMDEETADAILLANYKGSKKKPSDLITIAKATRFKVRQWRSIRKVAEAFGVSAEQVREFNSLLDLPPDVQELFAGDRTGVSKWYEVSKIPDPRKQSEVGKFVVNLGVTDTRAIVDYVKRYPELPVEACVQRVMESKTVKEDIHIIVVPLSQATFHNLDRESRKLNMPVEELASKLIEEALKRDQPES